MSCKGCPFRGRPKVKYEKNSPKLVVIGECPGKEELEAGKPFIGPSGQLLMKTFSLLGLKRKDYSILNSMRCPKYPDDSRTDIEKAVKHCKEYAMKALEMLQPNLIVLLGEWALFQHLNKKKIGKFRGAFHTLGPYTYIATYHPSYVLRQAHTGYPYIPVSKMKEAEKLFYSDLKEAVEYFKSGKLSEIDIDYSSIELPTSNVVAFDLETENLNVMHTNGKVLAISLAGTDKIYSSQIKNNTLKPKVREILSSPKIIKIVHNRPFDEWVCKVNLKCEVKGPVYDVMNMAHIVDENMESYNLEHLANVYTNFHNIKNIVNNDRTNLDKIEKKRLIKYVAIDAKSTLEIYKNLTTHIKKDKKLMRYYRYYIVPVEKAFADISQTGWPININKLDENEDALYDELHTLEEKLLPPGAEKLTPNVIAEYMFTKKGLGLKPISFTEKTNQPSTDKHHLKRFKDHPWVANLIKYNKIKKILSTYIPLIRKNLKPNGYIYPKIFLTGTVTGRTVMLDPPMQQFPTHGELAKYILELITAEDGYLIGTQDLSQSEVRIAGWLANDQNILGTLRKGLDIHTYTASILTGTPYNKVSKEQRQKAKPVVFGLLYGMQAKTLVDYAFKNYDIVLTEKEAVEYREKFFSAPNGYWRLPIYHKKMVAIASRRGYIRCVLGRKRHLPRINDKNIYFRSKAERQAINTPVQNFSSELACLGVSLFYKEINSQPKLRTKVKLTNLFIHDAYYYRAREDVIEKCQEILKDCFENRTKEYIKKHWGITVEYPIETEGKIGTNLSF